jgi:hypothetical protein
LSAPVRWRAYVGHLDHFCDVNLDEGGLGWDQAQAMLRDWVLLYADDEQVAVADAAYRVLEVLDDPVVRGRGLAAMVAGEWHVLMPDDEPAAT